MKRLCRTPHVVLILVASVIAALGFAPSALAGPGPGPLVSLGSASSLAVIAGTTITNTGPTVATGDMGVWPGTSVTGFPPGVVNGTIHGGGAAAEQAQNDAAAGDQQALGLAATPLTTTDIGGQTLTPGVYAAPNALSLTGTVTLDAQGDPNAVFIIRLGGVLTTAPSSHVVLVDGAQASNVYWAVGASATLGSGSTFAGTIIAFTSITTNTGVIVRGRLLARNGSVTLDFSIVQVPVGTTTTLTSTANPSAQGDQVSYTAAVTPDFGAQTVNDGTVAFSDGSGLIPGCETVAVVAGSATCNPASAPAAGSHTIVGTYTAALGNSTFDGSASQPLTQTVTPTPAPPITTTTTTTTGTTTTAPVTTTPPTPPTAPTAGSPSPTATATAAATSRGGVVKLDAGQSSDATGTTITGYRWYLGSKLIGRTKSLDYRIPSGVRKATFTLRVTDSAGETATSEVAVVVHGHEAAGALSATTLFTPNSARLTPAALRRLTKLRPVILASSQVTIDGYTAGLPGPQTVQRHKRSARLSANRAKAVETFLFHDHAPSGMHLSVSGMGRAQDSAVLVRNRKTTVSYTRFVVTSIT
jgi:outer membrane protein OmpA-like peptidoglycan-associated protein